MSDANVAEALFSIAKSVAAVVESNQELIAQNAMFLEFLEKRDALLPEIFAQDLSYKKALNALEIPVYQERVRIREEFGTIRAEQLYSTLTHIGYLDSKAKAAKIAELVASIPNPPTDEESK